MIGMKYH